MPGIRSTLLCAALLASPAFAAVSVTLTSTASSLEVGDTITVTAHAKDSANANAIFTYQFSMRTSGVGQYTVVKDFYTNNTFDWTPSDHEGAYDLGVVVKTPNGGYADNITTVFVSSRVTGSGPVVSNTRNPLVALYSAPPCSAPSMVRVRYDSRSFSNHSSVTPLKPCDGKSLNFYIAGMRANTTYNLQQDLLSGGSITRGPVLTHTTGSVDDALLPTSHTINGAEPPTSLTYPFSLRHALGHSPFATDLNENIVWYSTWYYPNDTGLLGRLLPGGTFLVLQDDAAASAKVCPHGHTAGCGDHQFLREFDLASNLVRETNWTVLNGQVNNVRRAEGKSAVNLIDLHHEGIRLPNGYTVTMGIDEQIKQQQGKRVDVLGDLIIVLDNNLQAVWVWDGFDHLDVNRVPVIAGGTCGQGAPGCPGHFYNIDSSTGKPYASANDWTHSNCTFYDSSDGNFIISSRNQSWVYKIAYNNGQGDGHLLWILGEGGTFQLPAGHSTTDWFSGQHDARMQSNGLLTIFDDGNARVAQFGGNSRGQAWHLDLGSHIATPVVNDDLGSYSFALGSAQLLSNGNYVFNSGIIGGKPVAQITEFDGSGHLVWNEETDSQNYRGYRLHDFYSTP